MLFYLAILFISGVLLSEFLGKDKETTIVGFEKISVYDHDFPETFLNKYQFPYRYENTQKKDVINFNANWLYNNKLSFGEQYNVIKNPILIFTTIHAP